jgi:hypothetical protein
LLNDDDDDDDRLSSWSPLVQSNHTCTKLYSDRTAVAAALRMVSVVKVAVASKAFAGYQDDDGENGNRQRAFLSHFVFIKIRLGQVRSDPFGEKRRKRSPSETNDLGRTKLILERPAASLNHRRPSAATSQHLIKIDASWPAVGRLKRRARSRPTWAGWILMTGRPTMVIVRNSDGGDECLCRSGWYCAFTQSAGEEPN